MAAAGAASTAAGFGDFLGIRSPRRGGVALNVGHTDPRYDVIVAWVQPAQPRGRDATDPDDDPGRRLSPLDRARATRREASPAPGSKHTYFDTIRATGIDTMQVALRASTHLEWQHFPSVAQVAPVG